MRFTNAYNEMGEKHWFMSWSLDAKGKLILEYTTVDNQGKLGIEKVIADPYVDKHLRPHCWKNGRFCGWDMPVSIFILFGFQCAFSIFDANYS